jgi:DNA-binding NtrC family response regulator/pSer/pThr/pTyr-binding forkhead associated (FHA) protein
VAEQPNKTTAIQDTAESEAVSQTGTVSLVLHHRDGAKVVPLQSNVAMVVGRAYPADVIVRDINVSRQHARFLWDEHGVWIEDLGSTNGTRVNSDRIEGQRQIGVGDEVTMGAVTASLLVVKDRSLHSIDAHDRFLTRLEDEVVRARTFGRPLAVLMVRAIGRERTHVRHWLTDLKSRLRAVDSVGAYGRATILVTLPETDRAQAIDLARQLAQMTRPDDLRLVIGVADFPGSGASAEELIDVARSCARTATLDKPTVVQESVNEQPRGVVVRDERMRRMFETVDRVARSSAPVLILGETGTGKEVVARAIHDRSPRRGGPLRSINCGAIPATLIESTLFGHERGAFTGADRRAAGIFEQANGGTVFLDEVGELPAAAQAALLRVLETKRLNRIGSVEEIEVDVRIVCATHRNLEVMCNEGRFRWDLYYRLNTITLDIPPLRDRLDDIEPLVRLFLNEASRASGVPVRDIDEEALTLLTHYPWPGNVRELRNVIERAVVVAAGDVITADDLSERVRGRHAAAPSASPPSGSVTSDPDVDFKERIKQYETDLIIDALRRANGNQTEAARILRMPLRTLVHKLRSYGIKKKFEL